MRITSSHLKNCKFNEKTSFGMLPYDEVSLVFGFYNVSGFWKRQKGDKRIEVEDFLRWSKTSWVVP